MCCVQEIYSAFESKCEDHQLRVTKHVCRNLAEMDVEASEYEGGVVIMAIDHRDSPSWDGILHLFAAL